MSTQYTSLKDYLDAKLPSSFMISLRNFFSFLPFVSAVDTRVSNLRDKVNEAKEVTYKLDYVAYYKQNKDFFDPALNLDDNAFKYTAAENRRLSRLEKPQKEEQESQELEDSEQLKALLALEDNDALDTELTTYFKSLEEQQKLQLIDEIAAKKDKITPHLTYVLYALYDDISNNDIEALLDKLPSCHLTHYCDYLDYKASPDLKLLIKEIDALEDKAQSGNALTNYRTLKFKLRPLRLNTLISEVSHDIGPISEKFSQFQRSHLKDHPDVVERISACLARLLDIANIFSKPKVREVTVRKVQQQKVRLELFDQARTFVNKVVGQEIMSVSYQRLRELFPEEEKYEVRLAWCKKMGVNVFDATNNEARKKALAEQQFINSFE